MTDAAPSTPVPPVADPEQEVRLRLALELGEVGTWSWDLATGTGHLDERGAAIVGLPAGFVADIAAAQQRSIHPDDLPAVMADVQSGLASGESFSMAYRVVDPDGTVRHIRSRARVFRDADGAPLRLLGTNRDVTEDRAQASRLEAMLERERLARSAAEAFLAVMSHELRTPVTSIFGTATLLARDPRRDDLAELVRDIHEEADQLRRIIDDLLVLQGVDRGHLPLSPEPILLQHAVPEVVRDARRRFPAVTFEVAIPPALPPVTADATALRQILYNLVSNAAKYAGQDGPVRVEVTDDGSVLDIAVLDVGPGVGDDPAALFELFHRAPHTAKRASGTGIGLYVASQLGAAMGTSIDATDRPGGGAAFRFRLSKTEED